MPYIAGVDIVGLAIILVTLPTLPTQTWPALALFVALTTMSDLWTVSMSGPGAISLSFSATYAAAVLFGPCFGALTACLGSFIAEGVLRRRGVAKTSFDAGQVAVVGGMTGLTFEILRTSSGPSLTSNALAYVLAAVVYVIVNSALASGVVALHRPAVLAPLAAGCCGREVSSTSPWRHSVPCSPTPMHRVPGRSSISRFCSGSSTRVSSSMLT